MSCKFCTAGCGISKHTKYGTSWHVSTCNEAANKQCSASCPVPLSASVTDGSKGELQQCVCCACECTGKVTCANGHSWCQDCFNNGVKNMVQVNDDEKINFLKSNCQVHCHYCLPAKVYFDMKVCASFLTQCVYELYMDLLTQKGVAKVQQDLERRLRQSHRELEVLKSSNPEATRIGACE